MAKRTKYQFICEWHEPPAKGFVRFDHEEARKDWSNHNHVVHNVPGHAIPKEANENQEG